MSVPLVSVTSLQNQRTDLQSQLSADQPAPTGADAEIAQLQQQLTAAKAPPATSSTADQLGAALKAALAS
jgi:hypothetical protein